MKALSGGAVGWWWGPFLGIDGEGGLGHCLFSGLRCHVQIGGGAVSDQGGVLGVFPGDRPTRGRDGWLTLPEHRQAS